ncbi:hypothetical protein NIES4103_29830 [Nostoc sp. NIES-4103]|nr:hypothetical protein NIES4103_29830 [Nostoc sp. NIES-4103]
MKEYLRYLSITANNQTYNEELLIQVKQLKKESEVISQESESISGGSESPTN